MPARLFAYRLRVKLGPRRSPSMTAPRWWHAISVQIGKGAKILDLDHYLEILHRKPGALPGATALARARASKAFTAEHDAFWAGARKAHGDAAEPGCSSRCCCCTMISDGVDVLARITETGGARSR